jgi:stearoyl-CoA desaturase (delta-9 desaturase)
MHLVPLVAFLNGIQFLDWVCFFALHLLNALAVPLALHRYFAHRSFKTSRCFQFVLGVIACTTFTDPIWFSGKHRIHHASTDTDEDVHSPKGGFWHCWFGHLVDDGCSVAELHAHTKDLMRFRELIWLHQYFYIPGVLLGMCTYAVGGFSMFAIGFCLSRIVEIHSASAVNYICHRWGTRRFETEDESTNSRWLAWLTLGEGWHNNHHYYPAAARAGFFSGEIDFIYRGIQFLEWLGLVWDVREVPSSIKLRTRL